jgi:hypothetical protein
MTQNYEYTNKYLLRTSRSNVIEDAEEDIQIMRIRGWRKLCKERAEWKKITEKAKIHSGL